MIFLTQPEIRQATIFTRLPDRFRQPDERNPWSQANRGGQPVDSFLEGPVWHPSGCLYVTDIPYGRIFRVDPSGDWELIVQYPGEPNGMKLVGEDTLLITDYRHGLMKLCLSERTVTPWLSRRNSESFRGVNDLTILPTRGRPGCTIPPGASTGCPGKESSTCCWITVPARTGWCSRRMKTFCM
ncbi:SMP-30/gluconolactonase/LRE family protein [Jejubacter calystegiae]|uniref:SMP-30/gluconolactonase/LRE family protein n=1 Tax=Jejubacter calystegiae TaxID=2579935 RepID=UPI00240DCFF4|nr:SMP-30/gluconolactonase/LRE family protein [Jejubacter calystegiae]